jgi:two-component system sensor histidine kinase KdpD
MSEKRPNPETLLQRAQEEERQAERGKLKIYLGAAPGVGKTYMMLKDAISMRSQGLDVVVGVVESHGRQEIISLLKELDILPPQEVEYRHRKLSEFNIDEALKRNPAVILIDEMAHTNVPGLRHAKRWQDIKEILDRGIDVYTTLNVQHIESLNDVVSQIIHTRIKETIPDSMLEMASTIELVDLPPEDLLKRLQEGKVYFPQQAELAADNFFRQGNLTALRELALRVTAERVGAQVLLYRQGQGIKHIWPTKEKIMVCVSSGTQSTKLIRAARRMATSLQAEWLAVHVDAPRLQLSEEQRNSAIQNLRLAEQLGAETKILTGFNVVGEIMSLARERNITKLIVGKNARSRWRDLLFSNLADELVRYSGEIDVYIITGQATKTKKPVKMGSPIGTISWKIYGISLATVFIATLVDLLLRPYFNESNLIMVYLLSITLVSLFGKVGPSVLASILSVITYAWLFMAPTLFLSFSNIQYFFTLLVMLLVSQVISHLTILTRRQAEAANAAEHRTSTLHSLSRQLATTRGVDKLLNITVQYISEVFNSEVLALLPEDDHLTIRARYKTEANLSAKEQGVAQWVFDLGQLAGLGTDTLPFSDSIYMPLLTFQGSVGVLRVRPLEKSLLFTPDQMHLLEACANQVALAIEVDRLQEQTKKTEMQTETDRMRSSLLQAVSRDMRSPLISVMGAATTLIEMNTELNPQMINKLGNAIYTEAEQVSYLINNLLQLTYLESEEVKLKKQFYSLENEIQEVLSALSKRLGKKPVKLHFPSKLPLIPFDKVLLAEVFTSLIDNAIKYTTPLSPIDISADLLQNEVVISIEDRGPGIVPDEVNKLFEKFYRGRMLATERGLGLGLSICKHLVTAHGGKIWAENRKDGGASFRFTLPLK